MRDVCSFSRLTVSKVGSAEIGLVEFGAGWGRMGEWLLSV
jgi:hypothetical protein